jgi:hypothetical protein
MAANGPASPPALNASQTAALKFQARFLTKTIPFEIDRNADRETFSVILSSISSYAFHRLGDDTRSAIAIKYASIVSADEKIKKATCYKG